MFLKIDIPLGTTVRCVGELEVTQIACVRAIKDGDCLGCFFRDNNDGDCPLACSSIEREDGIDCIFVEVGEGGEK